MDLLADLTPAQREAVTHVEGPLLVLAGAGSGKTRVITRRVANLLQHGIAGRNILALTFTNKAAGEMRERIEALVPGSGVWVGTFHSLCARLLRIYADRAGLDRSYSIYDQADRLRVIRSTFDQLGLGPEAGTRTTPERVEGAISRAKNAMVGPEQYRARFGYEENGDVVGTVYPIYQERLRAASAVDFDDLLLVMVDILRKHPEVRAELDARYRYVLVDEYQDTNLAQYAILRGLSIDHPNLCATGDPDQSIYGWRGANLNNILEFEHDFRGCRVVKLERNYRSTKNILEVADHLIRRNKKRKAKSLHTENPRGQEVELTVYGDETHEARAVAGKIASLVNEGPYNWRDIAVFCRVSALTRSFEEAFRQAGIPYQVIGGVAYYERAEVKDVLAYLNLIINPKDDVAFARVVNVPPRGIGKTTLDHLGAEATRLEQPLLATARQAASVPGLKDKGARAVSQFVALVDELAAVRDLTAEEAIRRVLARTRYEDYLEDADKSDDRKANVKELISAARKFDEEHPGASIVEFLEATSLASAVDRWKEEAGAVALMTMHAAKGLEFPVVFIVAIEEGILPHVRSARSDHELEEERRLLFVGITRAQHELYLSHCYARRVAGQITSARASQFLAELPQESIRVQDASGYSSAGSFVNTPTYEQDDDYARPAFRPSPASRPAPASWPALMTAADLANGAVPRVDAPYPPHLFRAGMMVSHPQYGLGRIISVEGEGTKRKGRIAFTLHGEKVLMLAQAPLRPARGAD